MEEIQFFGGASDTKITYFGAAVKAWSSLNANRSKLLNLGIQVPFTYIMNMEEALDVNSKSFTFPLKVIISSDEDTVYSLPKNAKNATAFQAIIREIEGDATILVSRTLPKNSLGFVPFYISADGLQMTVNNKSYSISFDLSDMFASAGLNNQFTYRLCGLDSGHWVIDSIIERSNPYVEEMYGKSISNLSEDAFVSFRHGFFSGFNAEDHYNGYQILNNAIKITKEFLISEIAEVSRNQGFFLGQMMKSKLGQQFSSLIKVNGSMADKIKTVASLGDAEVNQFKSFSKLHNAIVEADREVISSSLKEFFLKDMSPQGEYQGLQSFRAQVHQGLRDLADSVVSDEQWNSYSENLNFDMDMEFDISTKLGFDSAQFRIMEKSNGNMSLRFQSKTMWGRKKATLKGGKSYNISGFQNHETEIGIPLTLDSKNSMAALEDLNYSLPSTAGTKAVYAPLIIKDGSVVSEENNDVVICSLEYLKARFTSYFV